MQFPVEYINKEKKRLNNHPLLNNQVIEDINDLHIFMEHHVFAVWDFMSLVKSLQNHLCRSSDCWVPDDNSTSKSMSARLINEIVLAEETDYNIDGLSIISHFNLYCDAMLEVGADTTQIKEWLKSLKNACIPSNFNNNLIPEASKPFVRKTFEVIKTQKPHIIAATFAFGREKVIPEMFEKIIKQLNLNEINCPKLSYYLARHIEIDGDAHGPASEALVENLCENNPTFVKESENAAIEAIQSRIKLWDDITCVINQGKETQLKDEITAIAI